MDREKTPLLAAKRDIAKGVRHQGAARIDLKRVLKELEAEGHLEKRKRVNQIPDRCPASGPCCRLPAPIRTATFCPNRWNGRAEGVEPYPWS